MVLAAFGLRVTVMILILLRHFLAYKMIRRGLLIWEDFQGFRREEEGIELGRVAVLVFNCAFCFLGLDKRRKKRKRIGRRKREEKENDEKKQMKT